MTSDDHTYQTSKTPAKIRPRNTGQIKIHPEHAFAKMREAGRVAANCLDMLVNEVVPGVSTGYLDDLVREFLFDNGAIPATLYYRGYRHSSCISVNHVVCHGIPSHSRTIRDGDILNIDVTAIIDGWHGDTSRMYMAGKPRKKAVRLTDVTYQALCNAIAVVRPGAHFGDIGAAVEECARRAHYSVVEVFCGHGLGQLFHDAPNVLHFGSKGQGAVLQSGMMFTIEPMINLGRREVRIWPDGWTAVTRDRSLSAQFEHSIGVTDDGCEIFTRSRAGLDVPYRSDDHAPA